MLTLLSNKSNAGELRRLALQLANQLPESVADSRLVLEMTRDIIDRFLAAPLTCGIPHIAHHRLVNSDVVPLPPSVSDCPEGPVEPSPD